MAMTALPTAPSRADPSNFATRGDAFMTALPTFVTEANALQVDVSANQVLAAASASTAGSTSAVAIASANYKGLWSALAGALNMPASVSHNGNYWLLNANLANVATATPGVSASWQPISIGAGGALETSSGVDVTLTSASLKLQAIAMTAADKSVRLPNATTLLAGGELFAINNTGALAFAVRDSAGVLLISLDPGQQAFLYLSNASTSAGVWIAANGTATALGQTLYQALALTVNAVASTHLSVTMMSATQALAVWSGASSFLNCCTLNISGNVVTAGAVLTVNAVNSLWISVASVSATQAVVVYSGTSAFLQACTLNISGTIATNGTVLSVNAVAGSIYCAVAAMSSAQVIVSYSGTTSFTQACTLNISGTTLTAGAILSVNAINSSYQAITPLSTTQAVIAYSSSSAFLQCCTLNVSGTTLTAGAPLTLNGANSKYPSLATVSATRAVIAYTGPTPMFQLNARTLNISGTAITAGGILAQTVTPVDSAFSSLQKITANKFAVLSSVDGQGTGNTYGARAQILGLTDGQVSGGTPVTVKGAAGSYGALAVLSETKVLAVYPETSGFVQARILEIAA